MAFIPYVSHEEATGLLADLYARLTDARGWIDNILRIHSLNPPSMEHHLQLYAHLMRGHSPLSRVQREMIALTVSAANDCFY
jgi:alkylhydroperoxidase family enzyme